MHCLIEEDVLHIEVRDTARVLRYREQAMEPFIPQGRIWKDQEWDFSFMEDLFNIWMIW